MTRLLENRVAVLAADLRTLSLPELDLTQGLVTGLKLGCDVRTVLRDLIARIETDIDNEVTAERNPIVAVLAAADRGAQ